MDSFGYLFNRAKESPYLIIPGLLALFNGYWYKICFFICRKRVKIGSWFRVCGKLYIYGCGEVIIGDNCIIDSKLFKSTAFFTRTPSAKIIIGNNCGFNGTSIQAYQKVCIGDWCNIADAYIIDSKGHHVSADRRFRPAESVPSEPVIIHNNVWISTKTVVMSGVEIGENSVIGAFSLVNKSIPENCQAMGIPAKVMKDIPASDDLGS